MFYGVPNLLYVSSIADVLKIPILYLSMLSVAMKLREGWFAEKTASSALASMISVITFVLHNFYNLWGFVVFTCI